MVDAKAVDFFFVRDFAKLPPARDGQPGREVRNRSDDFHGIAGAAREVLHALMDENTLEGIDLVGIKSCERENSQAQSIETRFVPARLPCGHVRRSLRAAGDTVAFRFRAALARLAYSGRR